MILQPHHKAHLATSALSDEIIADRGYHSIMTTAPLDHMAPSQRSVPAIGIPTYRLGEPYTTITRPDHPRETTNDEGITKAIKYEWPARLPLVLDMLPRFRVALTDTAVPLWFTEGAKKADAIASHNTSIVPISVNGVWGWMDGKDADGNRCLLPDFRQIALRGRRVVLGFDSDYQVNEHVRMALDEFAKALEARGAVVGILQLPHGEKKLGVDDALADGGTFAELEQAVHWHDASGPQAEVERLRSEVERVQREKAFQAQRMQWVLAALSNPNLGTGERITNVFLKSVTEANRGKTDDEGAIPISIIGIAKESGQSEDSVSKHLAMMEKLGVLQRRYATVIKLDHDTGERKRITEVKVKLLPTFDRPLAIIAERNHGGKRTKRCADCGSENFIEKTTIVCEDCGAIHGAPKLREVTLEVQQEAEPGKQEKVIAVARRHATANDADRIDAVSGRGTPRNLRCLRRGDRRERAVPSPTALPIPQLAGPAPAAAERESAAPPDVSERDALHASIAHGHLECHKFARAREMAQNITNTHYRAAVLQDIRTAQQQSALRRRSMKISRFWFTPIKHRHLDAWQRKDAAIRRDYWAGRTPEELIDFDRYRRLPVARRRAIEATLYEQSA